MMPVPSPPPGPHNDASMPGGGRGDVSSAALVDTLDGLHGACLPTQLPRTTAWSCPPPGCSVPGDTRVVSRRNARSNASRGVARRAFGVVRSSRYSTPSAAASDTTSAVMRVTTSCRVVRRWMRANSAKQSAKLRCPDCSQESGREAAGGGQKQRHETRLCESARPRCVAPARRRGTGQPARWEVAGERLFRPPSPAKTARKAWQQARTGWWHPGCSR